MKLLGFLITGTVFNEHALSFPNVRVQVRKVGDKKYKWEAITTSRGEFTLRVPYGPDYEVYVHEKKYQDATKTVKTQNGDIQERVTIRLELKDAKP